MGKKRLPPHTIIPKDLYVVRDADRQLRQVITEMGRPGYVLVARQMGKTNLLLHAKRELETPDDLFVYVDLSRHFQSDRECFRTIIDTALDTYPVRLSPASARIQEARKGPELPSYKEHENELRGLIRSMRGRLVIILDEIDTLTNASFSDRIFAQVRSVYFSRTNYTEFEKLTYVLSGVVEPNDIIKDKKISPFNIGQKIYLDDFNPQEFEEFLRKAGLMLSQKVRDHVYSWTNGNPRITWDLCSAVEDVLLAGGPVTTAVVDDCVHALYLAQFNRAPIDHIRELVTDDQEIRSAVERLKSSAPLSLSDALRSKLYLAGIIGPNASGQAVRIKNKILEQALSKQWLRDVSIQKKGLLSLAVENYHQARYAEALELFEQYLAGEPFKPREAPLHYMNMGLCAYRSGQYGVGLKYFAKADCKPEDDPKLYWEKQYFSGLCHFQKQEYTESIASFASVVQAQQRDAIHVKSLLNWAAALTKQDVKNNAEVARETLQKVLDLVGDSSVPLSQEERTLLSGIACFNIGRIWEATSQDEKAREAFAAAVKRCAPKDRPAILLAQYSASRDEGQKSSILDDLAAAILSTETYFRVVSPENPLVVSTEEFLFILGELVSRSKTDTFEKLIEFLPQKVAELPKTRLEFIFGVATAALQKRNLPVVRAMLTEYQSKAEGLMEENPRLFTAVKYLALIAGGSEAAKYQDRVITCLQSAKTPGKLEALDLQVIMVALQRRLNERAHPKVLDIVAFVKSCRERLAPDLQADYAIIYYYEMKANEELGFIDAVLAAARAVRALVRSFGSTPAKPLLLKSGEMDAIKTVAENYIAAYSARGITVVKEPRFGPNEWVTVKYTDGVTKKIKYKKIKEDLKQQRCVLIE